MAFINSSYPTSFISVQTTATSAEVRTVGTFD